MTELIVGPSHDPHAILGRHPGPQGTIIRTLRRQGYTVSTIGEYATPRPSNRCCQLSSDSTSGTAYAR